MVHEAAVVAVERHAVGEIAELEGETREIGAGGGRRLGQNPVRDEQIEGAVEPPDQRPLGDRIAGEDTDPLDLRPAQPALHQHHGIPRPPSPALNLCRRRFRFRSTEGSGEEPAGSSQLEANPTQLPGTIALDRTGAPQISLVKRRYDGSRSDRRNGYGRPCQGRRQLQDHRPVEHPHRAGVARVAARGDHGQPRRGREAQRHAVGPPLRPGT